MRCLTVRQPWASLIAAGIKTVETRSWSTKHRGRIGVHAAAVDTDRFMHRYRAAWDALGAVIGGDAPPHGAIVATAELVDCVIIGRCHDPYAPETPELAVGVAWSEDRAWHIVGDTAADVTDQLPFGDFTPGRYAWLLQDIKPTTERCPACWGTGGNGAKLMSPEWAACATCWNRGGCDPIPAKGRQGLWRWTP